MAVRREVRIGIIVVLGLALAYMGVNFLKGINIFKGDNQYYVRLADLGGVSVASPVTISGYKVGAVREVHFEYKPSLGYGAVLTLALDPSINIPTGSQVKIKTNLLSGSELHIVPDSLLSTTYYTAGDTLPAIPAGADIMETAQKEILPAVADIMPQISLLLTRLNEVIASRSIDTVLLGLSQSTAELRSMMRQLNRSVAHMPQVMTSVEQMSSSFASLGRNVEHIRLDSVVHNLNVATENLRTVSNQLRSTDNTAGLLLNDPSLYNRLDSLANSADALMKDLKANPKRYVHFSLF